MGSTPVSGIAPWQPVPCTEIRNRVQPAIIVPLPHSTRPERVPEWTWSANPACGAGDFKMPASSMAFAPVKPSSSGWNTNLTVPLSSDWYVLSSLAAPSNIEVCISWPHACILPFSERNGKSVCSFIARASISARNKIQLPVFFPVIVATIPLSQISIGAYPISDRAFFTNSFVFGR